MNTRKCILFFIGISFSLSLCSCGRDSLSSFSLVQAEDNGLYFAISTLNECTLRHYDKKTGESQVVSENCFPLLDSDGRKASFDQSGKPVLFDEDENEVYLLQENGIEFVARLDLDVITVCEDVDKLENKYIFKITDDSVYWGFSQMADEESENTDMYIGIYMQDIHNSETSIVLEECYNEYFDIIGVIDNHVYIRNYDNQLLTVNVDTGEEKVTCESELLSVNNLIAIYEDGMIVFDDNSVYWSDLVGFEFEKIASLGEYNQFLYGIDRIGNTIYFVVEYDDSGRTKNAIASLDLESQNISLYHTFTGWKNRNLHVSDILMEDDGFYYMNSTNSKTAGGGLYYYNMQDETYTRILN